jgi:methyl-accepting chemotaxis protein
MSRRIVRPLENAIAVAGRIAGGDLTSEVKVSGRDETAALLRALRDMNASLRRIVGEVRGGTDMVTTASREIAQGNTDLSARTEQQASALEETSASMQQMTATVGQNAQNAKKANELAAQASTVALKGGEVVREAVSTMSGISQSSKKIADIIGVIDGIAFQTNILALNAAVEAARAGEQGRGFAVVASEVRSLAQRSAAAAKEIKDLITDSVGKVDAGSRQVNDAGRTMQEIVSSVKQVSGLIAEIAAASQEQAQGIEQVSETMTQLEKVTQQNAAMVEEASAAAGSLEQQSGALSSAVAEFKLDAQAR